MSENLASGRKAQTMPRDFTGATEDQLNQQIAAMTAHLAFCLERSKSIELEEDRHGHARTREVDNAIALAKTSAKLAMTMGKMQGELSYNFNYNHNAGGAPSGSGKQGAGGMPPPADLRLVPLMELPETPDGNAERRRRYREFCTDQETRMLLGDPPPPPKVRGSNKWRRSARNARRPAPRSLPPASVGVVSPAIATVTSTAPSRAKAPRGGRRYRTSFAKPSG